MNRKLLLDCLEAVKPGLASKELIEQSASFVFSKKEVYTFNDRISVNAESAFESPFPFAVKGNDLYTILNKLTAEEIDIDINEKGMTIKSGKAKLQIVISSDIKLPVVDLPNGWNPLPSNFVEALQFCKFSVGVNSAKPELCCFYIKENTVWSCDNYRMTQFKMDAPVSKPFLILGQSAVQLIKYKPIDYAIIDSWLHFQTENGIVFSCRSVGLEYPDLSELMNVEGTTVTLPDSLVSAIDLVSTVATADYDQDRFITLNFNKNKLVVKGAGSIGKAEEEITIKWKDKDISVKIHPNHLIDILKHSSNVTIGKNSCLFKDELYDHVVSLIE